MCLRALKNNVLGNTRSASASPNPRRKPAIFSYHSAADTLYNVPITGMGARQWIAAA
jgi:hypothetical protein